MTRNAMLFTAVLPLLTLAACAGADLTGPGNDPQAQAGVIINRGVRNQGISTSPGKQGIWTTPGKLGISTSPSGPGR